MVRVLGFGDNVVDKYEHTRTMYPGGNSLNFTAYAKQLCTESSAYMGYFGNDKEAEHVISVLDKIGVETYKCKQLNGANGYAKVTLSNGDRIFLDYNEGGIRKTHPYVLDRFDLAYIKTFDIVHSSCYSYTESELSKIRNAGVPLAYDFSDDSTPEYYAQVAPNVDYAFMSCGKSNEDDVKKHLKTVISYGCKIAVATRGSKGCIAYNGDKFFYQEALPCKVVDTMGAGDSLITAFLVTYIDQKKFGRTDEDKIIAESLLAASEFALKTCMVDGSFGYGIKY
jgi:fructoselysine 6-kinase